MGALMVSWGLFAIPEALPPSAEEPLLLAWSRLAAEHPARSVTALGLLLWACGRRSSNATLSRAPSGKNRAEELSSQGPFSGIVAPPQAPPHRSPWPNS